MSNLIRTYTITIGKVYNGEEECTSPHVELAGKQHIAVNCIDLEGCKYQVQLGPNDTEPCLTFFVTCEDCDVCGTTVIKKCFCESVDDCDECEICDTEGFCDKTCDTCCDGTCCECNEETPCTCNLVCQNGNCKCPAGTVLNANGCCDECALDSDCATCEVCVSHGGYKACELNDCNCDITGKCGEEGECVECLSSGHCPVNEVCDSNCECTCAPGYKRVNGICVPHECPNGDDDCEICEICSGEFCVPLQCPAGKVPAEVNGVCNCVQECNCAKPDCNSKFNYCGDSSIPGKCACLPCEGSCDAGCEDPCICDDDLNRCKFNPCFGPCDSGLDCGPTCGCDNGTCVPCDSLSCAEDDCSRALGCECTAAQKCAKDGGCDDAPCSVASDCNVGCTCDEGICQSCSNYSCQTSDCSDRDGCACNAGNCGPDSGECNDVATLEKDDDACELTATLTKDNCCQCPALTLDAKVTTVTDVSGQKRVTYTAEVRKGDYDGVSVDSNPLVDDFDNDNIAENEPPVSGTIKLSYVINYKTYSTVSGAYLGLSSANPFIIKKTYSATDGISQKEFIVDFPKIGTESTSGQIKSVVSSIDVVFSLDTSMSFENDCVYPAGTEIGTFAITSNETYLQTPIGSTITAPNCRKPFFKWTRFAAGSTVGDTFRKNYVDATSVGFYTETISGPTDAQSCYTYVFEPDCNCDDPVSKHIVFCNPSDFDKPVLTNCGKTYSFVIPATCSANITKYFELRINNVAVTVKGGKKFLLDTDALVAGTNPDPITSIVLHMICDTTAECDIEHTYAENNVEPIVTGSCKADGTVTFTFDTASYPGGISNVTFDGELKTSNFVFAGKLPNTTYSYQVTFNNGCVSDEKDVSWSCCIIPTLECSAGGKFKVITGGTTGITYNGSALPTSGIITPPSSGTAPLTYDCNGVTTTIQVQPYSEYQPCCNIVLSTYTLDSDAKTITIGIGSTSTDGTYTVAVKKTTGAIVSSTTLTNNGTTHTFTITSEVDASLIVEIKSSDTFCVKTIPVSFDAEGCDLGLVLLMDDDDCVLTATTDEKTCYCPVGKISGSVSAVTALPNNKLSATFAIAPVIAESTGKSVTSSSLQIYANGVISSTVALTSLTPTPITRTIDAYCLTTSNETVTYTAGRILGGSGGYTHTLQVDIPNPYIVNGITIGSTTYSPLPHTDGDSWYVPYNLSGSSSIIISFGNTVTSSTYTSIPINSQTISSDTFSLNVSTSDCYLCGGTVKGANIKLVYTVTLEDGCIYTGELSKQICVGSVATLSEVGLTNTNPSAKKMEFSLYKGATLLTTDYRKSPSTVNYSATDIDFKPGQEYSVTAACNCEETQETTECFETTINKYEPTGYVWGSSCNKKYGITIESCYYGEKMNVSLAGASKTVTLSSAGIANVTFDLPTSYTGTNVPITYSYQIDGAGTWCSNTTSIANGSVPAHTVDYNCTDGTNQEYTATIAITGGGTVLITGIPTGAGYGTISGASLVGITTTNSFSVTISINGSCSYLIPIYYDCSCNVTGATVAIPTISICAFREGAGSYTTSDKSIAITGVTQVAAGNWYTALGSTVIGGAHTGSSASMSITGAQLLAAAPISGANVVTLNISDTSGGDSCIAIPITINRSNVQYTPTATCGASSWSISVSSSTSPITLSNVSSGTVSGTNINNISFSTTSVTFKVNKGSCVSSFVTVEIPSGCAPTCSASEISITNVIPIAPCSLSGHPGGLHVYVSTVNETCPITSVYSAGQSSSEDFGAYWAITFPSDVASGEKTVTASTACGASCSKQAIATLTQDCCAQAGDVSLNTQPSSFCDTGGAVSVSVYNPYGFTISNWAISTGSWATGPSSTGGVVTVPGGQTQLTVSAIVKDALGNTCHTIYATVYSTDCDGDLCTGVVCGDCQMCQNGSCIPDPSLQNLQGPCDVGNVCCGGICTAACVAAADSYDDGCTYDHEVCASDCGAPVSTTPSCLTSITNLVLSDFTCIFTDNCAGTGSVTITKNATCPAFGALNIAANTVPMNSESDGTGISNGIYVTGGTIAGNTMTVDLSIASCGIPEDFTCNPGFTACGQTISSYYFVVIGAVSCPIPISVTLSSCSTCSSC